MPDEFPFLEVRAKPSPTTLASLMAEIRQALIKLAQDDETTSPHLVGYRLSQSVIQGDPEKPWDLSSRKESRLKKAIRATPDSVPLRRVADFSQGVTPGPDSLGIFLLASRSSVEEHLACPACEAEDVKGWKLGPPRKWLLYPYTTLGDVYDLGSLDLDLSADQAIERIEGMIAVGSVKYPRAARYLVRHFSQLASREAEKRTLKDYGKRWYEYHRPRDPKLMKSAPKIVTRRMTKNVEFALDQTGVVPTDGCFAITLKPESDWLAAMKADAFDDESALLFLLALLNSSMVKFLLKSTADTWQGQFYQVREDFLDGIPVKGPSAGNKVRIRRIVKEVKDVLSGKATNSAADAGITRIYGLTPESVFIRKYLRSH